MLPPFFFMHVLYQCSKVAQGAISRAKAWEFSRPKAAFLNIPALGKKAQENLSRLTGSPLKVKGIGSMLLFHAHAHTGPLVLFSKSPIPTCGKTCWVEIQCSNS